MRPEPGSEPLVARDATYHRAPEALRDKVRASLAREAAAQRGPVLQRYAALAAAFALVAVASWNAALLLARPGEDMLERDAVAAHVRSVMSPAHFNDVASTDQHTVKPWFTGKLDFSPPVADYAAAGFMLNGGRLDYLDGRPVAALTYKLRQHSVNLFVWPAQGKPDEPVRTAVRQGYALVRWTRGGMRFCAVSDVSPADLAALAELVRPAG
jgi:anti-sigma factor RsiW